jgi:hypothetical protein
MKAILGGAIMALEVMMGAQAPASAAATMTGNDVYAGCVLLAHPPTSPPPAKDILMQGYCAGAVSAVVATNPSVCPPTGWITGQAVAIVLRFMDTIRKDGGKVLRRSLLKHWCACGRARSHRSLAPEPRVASSR